MSEPFLPGQNPPHPEAPGARGNVFDTLVLRPEKILRAYHTGELTDTEVFSKAALFLVLTSLLFALSTMVTLPQTESLPVWQLVIRFVMMLVAALVLIIPAVTLAWAGLQKLSAWYWNLSVPFKKALGIAGLGIFYYLLMFALGLPVMVLLAKQAVLKESLLFALNAGAFVLSIRLFKQAYTVFTDAPPKRALWVACFPIAVLLIIYLLTQLLTYFAMFPHLQHV